MKFADLVEKFNKITSLGGFKDRNKPPRHLLAGFYGGFPSGARQPIGCHFRGVCQLGGCVPSQFLGSFCGKPALGRIIPIWGVMGGNAHFQPLRSYLGLFWAGPLCSPVSLPANSSSRRRMARLTSMHAAQVARRRDVVTGAWSEGGG